MATKNETICRRLFLIFHLQKLRMALDFDLDSEASYSNDLAEALKDIRAEYQAQLEAIKGGEDDAWWVWTSQFNTYANPSRLSISTREREKKQIDD